jgi:hypothetical protein
MPDGRGTLIMIRVWSGLLLLAGCGWLTDPDRELRITAAPDSPIPAGTVFQLEASPGGGIEWSSSDTTVASVSERGVLWGREEGAVTIVARLGSDSASVEVEVGPPGDGKIAFVSGGIRLVRPDGEAETLVVPYPLFPGASGAFGAIDISPDGNTLAFSWAGLDSTGLYFGRLDGTGIVKVLDGLAGGVFTAGGERMIIHYNGLREFDLKTGRLRLLWEKEPPGEDGAYLSRIGSFALSPDAKFIYFAGTTEGFPYKPGLGLIQSVDSLYVAELSDIRGTRRAIAPELGQDVGSDSPYAPKPPRIFLHRVSINPAGTRLLVVRSLSPWCCVYLVELSGPMEVARVEPLDLPLGAVWNPAFAPDGSDRFVAVQTEFVEADEGLAVVDLATLEVTPIIQRFDVFGPPIWRR